MKLSMGSLGLALGLLFANVTLAQTFTFDFDLDTECGGEIVAAPGEQLMVSGFLTLETSQAGVGGLTQSVVVDAMDGGTFCIDPTETEACTPDDDCKAPFFAPTGILAIFPTPTSFVIQNAEGGCLEGAGDPADNGGRRGLVDSTLFNIGQTLAAGMFMTLPVDFVFDFPTAPGSSFTYEIRYEDGLRAAGQPQNNGVSFQGATVGPCEDASVNCGVCSLTLTSVDVQPGSLPGDADGNGVQDLMDAISLLFMVFEGNDLPCAGEEDDYTSACNLALLDVNDDGRLDQSDAVYIARFVVLGEAPPVGGGECRAITGAPNTCESGG